MRPFPGADMQKYPLEWRDTAELRRNSSLRRLILLFGLVSLVALPSVVGVDVLSAVLTPLR
jgi:hypothetical protein